MKALLVDRLGFERITESGGANTIIVPRRDADGESEFEWYGRVERNGEEMVEYREVDDMPKELQKVHDTTKYLRGKVRELEGAIRSLESENGRLALELRRASNG